MTRGMGHTKRGALVLWIKSSIEGLHYRLEEAGSILDYQHHRHASFRPVMQYLTQSLIECGNRNKMK